MNPINSLAGGAPPLSLTHAPVGRSVSLTPSPSESAHGQVMWARRPFPLGFLRNRLAGDEFGEQQWSIQAPIIFEHGA